MPVAATHHPDVVNLCFGNQMDVTDVVNFCFGNRMDVTDFVNLCFGVELGGCD